MKKRNLVRQVITLVDGTTKVIFHPKKFHAPQYADRKQAWDMENKAPKPNSKRQKLLNAQRLTILETA